MRWIRLWTEETVYGTTFTELNAEERGVWWSLLVMAGLPPTEGVVELRKGIAWPLELLASFINVEQEVLRKTLERLTDRKIGKVEILPDKRLKIRNWKRYQTEYAKYRKGRRGKDIESGRMSKEEVLDAPPRQKEREKEREKKKKKEKETNQILEMFLSLWNGFDTLPKIGIWNTERRTKLRVRCKSEDFRREWATLLAALAGSPFHTGCNDRKWKADVDWFLRNDTNPWKAFEQRGGEPGADQYTHLEDGGETP